MNSKFSILAVDDEPDLLEVVTFFLDEINDCTITTAFDGLDALEKIKAGEYNLIISDIRMPRMEGIELLEKVREEGFTMPFIFLSAYGNRREELLNSKFDVFDFIPKPIEKDKFIDAVKRALDQSQ